MASDEEPNGKRNRSSTDEKEALGNDTFQDSKMEGEFDAQAIGANIRTRRNYLAPKFNDDKGQFTVDLKSSWTSAKEQAMNSGNYKMGITIALENAKKREKQLLSSGKYTEEQLAKTRRAIRIASAQLEKLNATK